MNGPAVQPWPRRNWIPALLLIAAALAAALISYRPALTGQFLWDDDAWTTRLGWWLLDPSGSGLAHLWTHPAALQQYYPLTATAFWIDAQLWGFQPLPYHLENLALHLGAALLFWRLLRQLDVPGAPLAALLFALHPVMVESVAWIAERKNVLSLFLYLAALLAYGRFIHFWRDEAAPRRPIHYAAALLLFLAALLAKGTAVSFPAVLLVLGWWKKGRIEWRRDLLPTLPFFLLALGFGLGIAALERHHVGAEGRDFLLSFPQRCLVAGRAPWFYLGQLLWPGKLSFIYPKWHPDPAAPWQWLYPIALLGLLVALWEFRSRIGRGPAATALFFVVTLLPTLGFLNGYFMRYSFVWDHLVYLSSLGPIALAAALVAQGSVSLKKPWLLYGFAALVLPILAFLTWKQAAIYTDTDTLWRATLARNPEAWLAQNNLGNDLVQAGRPDEAIPHLEKAIAIDPQSSESHNNLGSALAQTGRLNEAVDHYERALELDPANASALNNLAWTWATAADPALRHGVEAVGLAEQADQIANHENPFFLRTLAAAYAMAGRFPEALDTAHQALALATDQGAAGLMQNLQIDLAHYVKSEPLPASP